MLDLMRVLAVVLVVLGAATIGLADLYVAGEGRHLEEAVDRALQAGRPLQAAALDRDRGALSPWPIRAVGGGLVALGLLLLALRRPAVAALLLLVAPLAAGCAKYYYHHPEKLRSGFDDDSRACIRDVGIPSSGGRHALVTRATFQRCMEARGWLRAKKLEPVELGWYRGIEGDDVVSLETGIPQDAAGGGRAPTASRVIVCRQTHLENTGGRWRDQLPDYQACLRQ